MQRFVVSRGSWVVIGSGIAAIATHRSCCSSTAATPDAETSSTPSSASASPTPSSSRPPVKGLVSSAKKPKKFTPIGTNPLARWSNGLTWVPSVCGCPTTHGGNTAVTATTINEHPTTTNTTTTPRQRLVLPIAVGLEGCNKAFNATNALRTSLYFGACCPPTFLGAKSAADILSLQQRQQPEHPNEEGSNGKTAADTADVTNESCATTTSANGGKPAGNMLYGPLLPSPFIDAYAADCTIAVDEGGRTTASSSSTATTSQQWAVVSLENYTERCVSVHTVRMTDAYGHAVDDAAGAKETVEKAKAGDDDSNEQQLLAPAIPPTSSGLCILMGDENKGVSAARLEASSLVVYVPQYGTISSLNVVTTLGLALFYAWMDMVCPQNRELVGGSQTNESNAGNNTDGINTTTTTDIQKVLNEYFGAFQKDLPMVEGVAEAAGTTDGRSSCGLSDTMGSNDSFASASESVDSDEKVGDSQRVVRTPSVVVRESAANDSLSSSLSSSSQQQQQPLIVPWDGVNAWNNIRPGLDRVDARPIHPLFYNLEDDVIGERYKAFYRKLEGLCRPLIDALVAKEVVVMAAGGMDTTNSTNHSNTAHQPPSLSLQSLLPCALYENDFDQRNLGGLIRNANAFMCPTVYYVGKRKINIKGAVGCNHYTPPQYLGKFKESEAYQQLLLEHANGGRGGGGGGTPSRRQQKKMLQQKQRAEEKASSATTIGFQTSANGAANDIEPDAATAVKAMLSATGRELWLLSCDHDALYGEATAAPSPSGGEADGEKDPYAHCYSTTQSLEAYKRLVARCEEANRLAAQQVNVGGEGDSISGSATRRLIINLTDDESTIRANLIYKQHQQQVGAAGPCTSGSSNGGGGGIVLLVPQEGKVPHHDLLALCTGIIRILPREVGGCASSTPLAAAVTPADTTSTSPLISCRGLPSQVASGIALHRLVTSCVPCLKM